MHSTLFQNELCVRAYNVADGQENGFHNILGCRRKMRYNFQYFSIKNYIAGTH